VCFGIIPEKVRPFRETFGVPDSYEPTGAIAIGYNAEPKARDLRSKRKPLDQIMRHGQG
jgi:nitroreductase